MRLDWLADVLLAAGVTVRELPGWKGRGVDLPALQGIVCHHTATPDTAPDEVIARLLRDGRSDLKGPLSQLGLDRSGTWWVVADGKANHNGYGLWGNGSLGIEAFNNGRGEPWPPVQVDSWVKGCAALCKRLDFDVSQVKGHKETDSRRKIDPHGIDMGLFRTRVRTLLEDDMFTDADRALLKQAAKDAKDAKDLASKANHQVSHPKAALHTVLDLVRKIQKP